MKVNSHIKKPTKRFKMNKAYLITAGLCTLSMVLLIGTPKISAFDEQLTQLKIEHEAIDKKLSPYLTHEEVIQHTQERVDYNAFVQDLSAKIIDIQHQMREADDTKFLELVTAIKAYITMPTPVNSEYQWLLNSDWSIKPTQVSPFVSDKLRVVFELQTKSGDLAGLVHADFDEETKKLVVVSKNYTREGLNHMKQRGVNQ